MSEVDDVVAKDPLRWRRWAASYGLSLALHALATLLFALVSINLISTSTTLVAPSDVTVFRSEIAASSAPAAAPVGRAPLVRPVPPTQTQGASRPVSLEPSIGSEHAPMPGRHSKHAVRPGAQKPLSPPLRPELARKVLAAESQGTPQPNSPAGSQTVIAPKRYASPASILPAQVAPQVGQAAQSVTLPTPDLDVSVPTLSPSASVVATPVATAVPSAAPAPASTPTIRPTPALTPSPSIIEPSAEPVRRPSVGTPAPSPAIAATAAPVAVLEPTSVPTVAPSAAPTSPPTVAPTAIATAAQTVAPTAIPTAAQTVAPSAAPTAPPTVAPRAAAPPVSTAAPAIVRTAAPAGPPPVMRPSRPPAFVASASPVEGQPRTTAENAAPSMSKSGAAQSADERGARSGESAARASSSPRPGPTGFRPPAGEAAKPAPVGFTQPGSSRSVGSLNDRLKNLTFHGDVDYRPKRVAIGDAQSVFDSAMLAYERRFAPPPDILGRTFGFIYQPRTSAQPDSLAYIYDTYSIGPIKMCKAWKITEHPYQTVYEVGAVARSAGIGGAVASNANSPDVRHDNGGDPDVLTVVFPCTEKSYRAVPRGSLKEPLSLHPVLAATPVPAASGSAPTAPPLAPR